VEDMIFYRSRFYIGINSTVALFINPKSLSRLKGEVAKDTTAVFRYDICLIKLKKEVL